MCVSLACFMYLPPTTLGHRVTTLNVFSLPLLTLLGTTATQSKPLQLPLSTNQITSTSIYTYPRTHQYLYTYVCPIIRVRKGMRQVTLPGIRCCEAIVTRIDHSRD